MIEIVRHGAIREFDDCSFPLSQLLITRRVDASFCYSFALEMTTMVLFLIILCFMVELNKVSACLPTGKHNRVRSLSVCVFVLMVFRLQLVLKHMCVSLLDRYFGIRLVNISESPLKFKLISLAASKYLNVSCVVAILPILYSSSMVVKCIQE